MERPLHRWLLFALCLAVVFGAMCWVSATAVRLERSEREARRWAAQEENVRLALWRMDSSVAPLIAQESARPYFAYSAFYPAERAYNRMFAELRKGEVLVPSRLLTVQPPQVLLYFQFGPGGELTSPQVPTDNMRELAKSGYTTSERIKAASARLAQLGKKLKREALLAELPLERPAPALAAQLPKSSAARPRPQTEGNRPIMPNNPELQAQAQSDQQLTNQPAQQMAQQPAAAPGQQEFQWQMARNTMEYQARQAQNFVNIDNAMPSLPAWNPRELEEGALKPLWVGPDLVLARRVRVEGRDYIQGCLLDWPVIRASLLAGTRSLLPRASLSPVTPPSEGEVGYMMASLPVRLVPGPALQGAPEGLSPMWLSLGTAWACVLAAAIGGALVLARAISLSERRGAFVSAVTHELRTPLTTFKMYAEMLAEDMVPVEAKRRQYLETLRVESVRLGHLVENVLAYARLERGRAAAPAETTTLEGLIARQRDRLAARAEQAEMRIVVEPGEHWQAVVRVDSSSVEQILFNLVDNACKYAGRAPDRRIHIAAGRSDGFATLTVRDHGPGISDRDAGRLFRAFHKSARDAANSAPGIGLGLALSRRLARRMGGGLRLDSSLDGASFTLLLAAG